VLRRGGKQLRDGAEERMWRDTESRGRRRDQGTVRLGGGGEVYGFVPLCTLPQRLRELRWVLRR
jgi:hypothetical protein